MKHVTNKSQCCGCGACTQRCPKQCINVHEDGQGFLYPHINETKCIDCGLCEKICPVLNHGKSREPIVTFAAMHYDEQIRLISSSGGVFTAIAEHIIGQGGVVFGARFHEQWEVVHDYTETIEGLAAFRGSKYVQSVIGNNYFIAEQFLKQGRQVLFTGTPCQVAGLKNVLRKDYNNLLTVDVACHGVPSPLVWRAYLKDLSPTTINFRDKSSGWKNYSVRIGSKSKLHDRDDFMNCFLGNYSIRPSCFKCEAKHGKSGADITIADLWGCGQIAQEMDDDKGTSAVITWSEVGLNYMKLLELNVLEIDFEKVIKCNPAIVTSFECPTDYNKFWLAFDNNPSRAITTFGGRRRLPLTIRIKQKIRKLLFLK